VPHAISFNDVLDIYVYAGCDAEALKAYLLACKMKEQAVELSTAFIDNYYKTSYQR